jgi:hypothetical protein
MKHQNYYLKKVFKISLMGLFILTSMATGRQAAASTLHGPNFAPPHVVLKVDASEDDVSQSVPGSTYLNGSVLPMGDTGGVSQFVGLRFTSVNVPQGAQITDSYLEFTALGDSPGVTTLTIAGHAVDDSPAFSAGDGPMERQTEYTSATVTWDPLGWFDVMSYRSSDVSSIIQEIVDRQNWIAGNTISLFVLDDGVDNVVRQAYSYDLDDQKAPLLTIVYQEPLKVDPEQILAQGEVVLNPPPGFTSSSWIYPADYSVGNLSLYRAYEPISLWHEPYDFGLNWYQPYLGYDLSIWGNGEILDEEQAEWVANQTLIRNLEGTIHTYGSEGTIYYHQMENAAPMCFAYGLLAFIPNGLSGDTNPANDWGVGSIEYEHVDDDDFVGPPFDFDRDLRFTSEGPSASYWGPGDCTVGMWDAWGLFSSPGSVCGDLDSGSPGYPLPESSAYIRVKTESEAIGACPPMLTDSEPFYFPGPPGPIVEPIADLYHVWVTVFRNGDVVSLEGPFPPGVNPAVSLPGELENRDVICVDIALDPPMGNMDHGFILETNENNNRIVLLYGWNTNAWRGNKLYLAAELTEPPIPTCQEATEQIEQIILDNYSSYLIIGSFVGILVFGLVGGTVGLFFSRFSTGSAIKIFLIACGLIGGAIVGGLVGYVGGSILAPFSSDFPVLGEEQVAEIQPAAQPLIDLSNLFDQGETCEAYFKTHAEAVTNQSGEIEDIQIIIAVPGGVTLPPDSRFQVTLWDNNGLPRQFATNNTVISLAEAGFFPDQVSNLLVWQVGLEVLSGAGGDLFLPHCLPDGLHTFKFEGLEETQVRVTPVTPTPTQPVPKKAQPTATTPPKVADTKGPKVSGASASPNPALTTSPVTISATVSDSSGVARAKVYIKTGKGGYQSIGKMKSGGGNNYFLNIGTLTPAGTYTFRILAEDSLGNTNCSTGNLDACPGGSFVVNLP